MNELPALKLKYSRGLRGASAHRLLFAQKVPFADELDKLPARVSIKVRKVMGPFPLAYVSEFLRESNGFTKEEGVTVLLDYETGSGGRSQIRIPLPWEAIVRIRKCTGGPEEDHFELDLDADFEDCTDEEG